MNTISFTPYELILLIVAISGGIVTIYQAVKAISELIGHAKQPTDKLRQQITEIDIRLKKLENHFDATDKRIHNLENGDEVTQEAILALLNHALNNNNTDGLRSAKTKMEQYLISRGTKV